MSSIINAVENLLNPQSGARAANTAHCKNDTEPVIASFAVQSTVFHSTAVLCFNKCGHFDKGIYSPLKEDVDMKRKSPKQYTERFKKEAINLILEQGYTVQQAANALGITTKLLYAWRKRHEAENKPNALTAFERQELLALRKEVKQLKMEKEILKKASAFFAKELL